MCADTEYIVQLKSLLSKKKKKIDKVEINVHNKNIRTHQSSLRQRRIKLRLLLLSLFFLLHFAHLGTTNEKITLRQEYRRETFFFAPLTTVIFLYVVYGQST